MKLEMMAQELEGAIRGLPSILETMERESGRGTASGAPAPIFVPVLEAAKTALGNVGTSLFSIREKVLASLMGQDLPAETFMEKPVRLSELVERIDLLLQRAAVRTPADMSGRDAK